jgi:SH3-like domain-containing protein
MNTGMSRSIFGAKFRLKLAVPKSVASLLSSLALAIGISFFGAPSKAEAVEPVCVVSSKANLRAGPTTKAKITWVVGRNMPLERISVANGWSQVKDLRGRIHWVISRNVSTEESCAVVRVRTAALHVDPKPGSARAEMKLADRYTPFKKVDREGMWVRLEDDYNGAYWTRDTNVWIPVKRTHMSF